MASPWWRVSAHNFNKTNHTCRHEARAPLCAVPFHPTLCFGDNDVPGSGSPMRHLLTLALPIEPHRATPRRLDCLACPRITHGFRGGYDERKSSVWFSILPMGLVFSSALSTNSLFLGPHCGLWADTMPSFIDCRQKRIKRSSFSSQSD